jgi:4'-phosphopantetheinyl transferase EntD
VQHPHGVLVALAIEDDPALDVLHPDEVAVARAHGAVRRRTFVAGRIALAHALAEVGAPRGPVSSDERGAPVLPAGFVGSISHKNDRAIALAAKGEGDRGVDLEVLKPIRAGLAEMILTIEELARIGDDPSFTTLASFSVKESIYKAIAPRLRRYVGFHEAVLVLPEREEIRAGFALVEVRMQLTSGESLELEATVHEREGEIVSTARVLR